MYITCYRETRSLREPVITLQPILIGHNNFTFLPKIHKDSSNPPGRPIASGSAGPTERVSQLVDHVIGNLVPKSQSYIRDSTHLINILNEISLQPDMLLCTLDITSLYTNIPHNEGIEAIKKMLAIHRPPDTKTIQQLHYRTAWVGPDQQPLWV